MNEVMNTNLYDLKSLFKKIDLILAPAMGGIIIGYEIGKLLKKETIFCERVKGRFTLRRGFKIKKGSKVLIIEDVITTGKSSLECVKLIKKAKASLLGFATIIDRSSKKSLKIKKSIVSKKGTTESALRSMKKDGLQKILNNTYSNFNHKKIRGVR